MVQDKKTEKPIRISALDEDILTVLLHRELYGLEMLELLNKERPSSLGFGSLYPALNRLEKKGLVSWKWGDESDTVGGARRKYYRVTGLGSR
ncbi:MAG: helix-turn-helix transcriptional regulator, partial [Cyanobacteria bacterium P01_E01_bin.42]